MILPALAGLSMLVTAVSAPDVQFTPATMSVAQKNEAVRPAVLHATECVARAVSVNPDYDHGSNLGDLIVASMPACKEAMRAMIADYDRYFGDGMGEAFFSETYLDLLPTAVVRWVSGQRQ